MAAHPYVRFVSFLLAATAAGNLAAHDPGFSTAAVTVGDDRIEALVTFSSEEVELLIDRGSFPNRQSMASRVLQIDGGTAAETQTATDGESNSTFRLSFAKSGLPEIEIRSPLVSDLNPGHRQYLIVRDSRHDLLFEKFLKSRADSASVVIANTHSASARKQPPAGFGKRALLFGLAFVASMIFPLFLFWLLSRGRNVSGKNRLLVSLVLTVAAMPVCIGAIETTPKREPPPPFLARLLANV